MKALCTMVMLLLGICHTQAQQEYAVAHIKDHLKSRSDAVVRHETIVADMQAPTKVRYQVKQVVTVFNQGGESKARLVVYYDKNTAIKRITGRVFDAHGFQIGKFNQRNFRDESAVNSFSLYEDSRVKHFLPAVTTYPYTVEYEYELELKQNLIIPDWRPDAYRNVAVEHSQYTFVCADLEAVRVKSTNYNGQPLLGDLNGRKTITWQVVDIPAQRYEPYSPNPETYQTVVKIAPTAFVYYNHKGRYADWQDLGQWMHDALLVDGQTLPAGTVQEVRALVADMGSDKEKAKALYAYMQRKTRYVSVQIGIGGFKPMVASEVDRLGYGDCKALVNYMQALLRAVDIPSYYCVVYAGNAKRDMQADFAGMEQGNHVILCLPFEQDTTWLECTNQRIPFGFLGSFTDDRTVWACTPQGGQILRTPRFDETESTQLRKAELVLNAEGTLLGNVETVFAAGQYDNHLEIAKSSGMEQSKLLRNAYDVDNLSFSNLKYDFDQGIPALREIFEVKIDRYVPSSQGTMYLVPNLFNRRGSVPVLKSRTTPVYVNRGYTDEDRITYTLQEGVQLATDGYEIELSEPFGYYKMTLAQEGDKLLYHRKFVLNEGTFPPQTYTAFADFMNKVNATDHMKVVLK